MNKQEYHEKDVVSLAMATTIIMHTDLGEDGIKELVAAQRDSRPLQAIDFDEYTKALPKKIMYIWSLFINEVVICGNTAITGRQAWDLHQDHDIGLRAIRLLAALVGMDVDEDGFWEYFNEASEL